MKISTRGRYGLRAMADLASRDGGGSVKLKSIAERQGISEHYLEQLAAVLKKAGLINSERGSKGGYRLNAPPEKIIVGDILRALEGPLYPVGCVSEDGDHDAACGAVGCEGCVTRPVWQKIYGSLSGVVDTMTLRDLTGPIAADELSAAAGAHTN